MNQTSGSKPAIQRAPEHLRWDVNSVESHECSLATASATATEIVLSFGARKPPDPIGEVTVELLQRVALNPLTAKNLAATLRRLIEDHDGALR